MINLKIDHIEIQVEENLSILEAAGQAGINIPSLCFLKDCRSHPSCMVCMVMDKNTNALVPSCSLKVAEGMEIDASSEAVRIARRQALEMLLSDHVGDCVAPCTLACPAGMDIPLMNRLIAEGRFTEALNIIKEDIALPYILGYICPAPCENACRRRQVDDPASICLLKRFAAEEGEDKRAAEASRMHDEAKETKKVAIIGSGPAGLTAAYYLQLLGYSCSVFERSAEAGGTLRYDIPEEQLPRNVIDVEVDLIQSMGVNFYFNTLITAEIFNEKIIKEYDAIIIATGDISTQNKLKGLFELSRSGIEVNQNDLSSSQPGVFVCGSAVKPQKAAVRTVAQAKTAALSAHHFLQGQSWEKPAKKFNSRFSKLFEAEFTEFLKESSTTGRVQPEKDPKKGFVTDEAIREALRCGHCDCRKKDNCKLRDYAEEYKADKKRYMVGDRKTMVKQLQHDLIIYEQGKCIKCGLCVEISNQGGEKFGIAFEGRGFDMVINAPLGKSLNESLTHTAVKCAQHCPTGALSLKDKYVNLCWENQKE
jgi:ferredoxin